MPAGTAMMLCGVLFSFQGGTGLADTVQNGTAAVHLKAMVGGDMGQKLLADSAFQMNQLAAGYALEMEVAAAVPQSHILVDVGGLGIAPILPHKPFAAQLREMAVYGTLTADRTVLLIHFSAKLLRRKLAIGPAFQKFQQALSPRRLIYARHGIPPFGTASCSIQV